MKLLLPLVMITLLALQRCDKDEVEVSLPPDQFILKLNDTFEADDFKLQLTAITDSRCPKGVNCIWAGAAITTLALDAPSRHDTLQLCLGSCGQVSRPFQEVHIDTLRLGGREYELSLLEVNPFPGTEKEGQEKTALFRLRAFFD